MQLNFHRQGFGAAVVLIHGLFGSWENLRNVAKSLSEHFEVIAVDLPNHGKSPHCDDISYRQMSEQVGQLMVELGIDKYSLLGHSMGGKVAMQLAIDQPEHIEKLIVVDIAPVAYTARHDSIFDALSAIDLTQISNRQAAEAFLQPLIPELGVRQFLLKGLAKEQDQFVWRFNLKGLIENYHNMTSGLVGNGAFLGSTLFVKGGDSDYLLTEHRETILGYFPNSKARVISGAGHWVHAEKPALFNRLVNDFLLT